MADSGSINHPAIRVWDINENSTHYDKMMAAPTDYERRLMWILWSSIMYVVVVFASIVFIGILSSRKARENPFNIYLIFLMIPDIFMSLACFITCALNAIVGHFYSPFACYFQSFYMVFGICANAWMNAIIAKELFALLRGAKEGRPFDPPSIKKVIYDSILVYIGSIFVASWGLIDQPWWPHKTGLLMGTACVPTDYDTKSTIFFYCVYFPALMGLPLGYVMYVCYRIHKDNLMPHRGKRRVLAIYFLRLTAVFVVMWLPALFFFFILGAWVPHWVVWAGGAWSHLQGLVSAAVSLLKPDIFNAVRRLLCCQWSSEVETSSSEKRKQKKTATLRRSCSTPCHKNVTKSSDERNSAKNVLPAHVSSRVGTFSEAVGWKTQVETSNEEGTPTNNLSEIGTFSEMVGWKTQAEPNTVDDDNEEYSSSQDEEDEEEGTPVEERRTSRVGTFSEIVGWNTQVELIITHHNDEESLKHSDNKRCQVLFPTTSNQQYDESNKVHSCQNKTNTLEPTDGSSKILVKTADGTGDEEESIVRDDSVTKEHAQGAVQVFPSRRPSKQVLFKDELLLCEENCNHDSEQFTDEDFQHCKSSNGHTFFEI